MYRHPNRLFNYSIDIFEWFAVKKGKISINACVREGQKMYVMDFFQFDRTSSTLNRSVV